MSLRYYIKLLAVPLFLLAIFASLLVIAEIAELPPEEEIVKNLEVWFEKYGLSAIFISSIIEGTLVVGSYFPGIFVIFLAVALSNSLAQAFLAVLVATVGLFLAHLTNYTLGRYGWYRLLVKFGFKSAIEKSQDNLLKRGPLAIFSSYWLPSVAALTDTAAGIIQMPFKKFALFSLASVVIWSTIAGTIVYSFKESALSAVTPGARGGALIIGIIVVWIVIAITADFYSRRKSGTNSRLS